jgi:hypothetical protein
MRVRLLIDSEVTDTVGLAELASDQPTVIVIVDDEPTDRKLYGRLMGAQAVATE